jgi:hypothetical protein
MTSDTFQALMDQLQSQPTRSSRQVEAFAIIANLNLNLAFLINNTDIRLCGFTVPRNVRQAFLDDPI